MDVRRSTARFLGVPEFIAHPNDVDVRRTQAATRLPLGAGWRPAAAVVGLAVVMALSGALAVGFGRGERTVVGTNSIVGSHLGPGYPPHHGLAGPSQVGPSPASWMGYPPHYGLAGPSRVGGSSVPIGIGPGYPPHYGLAGPSQIDDGS